MFVYHKALIGCHLATAFFHRGEERNQRRLEEEGVRAGMEMASTDYGIPLTLVTSFKYLVRFLSAVKNDWPSVVHKLCREW